MYWDVSVFVFVTISLFHYDIVLVSTRMSNWVRDGVVHFTCIVLKANYCVCLGMILTDPIHFQFRCVMSQF